MKNTFSIFRRAVLASIAALTFTVSSHGDDLGDALKHVGWENIIGTWVDSDTKGRTLTTTYAWKFENKLIEVNSSYGDTKSASLMAFDPDNESVYVISGDNKGGGSMGRWSLDGDDAVLQIQFRTGDGGKGTMKLVHHKVDKDTLKVTISLNDSDDAAEITLVRAKKK